MKEITVTEAKKLIDENKDNKNFVLLDVRGEDEYAQGHIEGCVLIPLSEIDEKLNTFDKSKEYLVYCRSGARSTMATKMLESANINATNMAGGFLAWIENNYKTQN